MRLICFLLLKEKSNSFARRDPQPDFRAARTLIAGQVTGDLSFRTSGEPHSQKLGNPLAIAWLP
jgi:hypothetical protein